MIRKTLTILSLLGLLLSVGLWGLSYLNLVYVDPQSALTEVRLTKGRFDYFFEFLSRSGIPTDHMKNRRSYWDILGFRGLDTEWWPQSTQSDAHWFVHIPLWMPTLLFGSILYFCRPLHYRRRRKRRKLGLCLKCGYDLRGSSERCPECGEGFVCSP